MNAFIVNLRLLDYSFCHVNHQYVGCFLYVDDIILISPSINCLHQILVVCSATAKSLAFMFNGNKSQCLSLGKQANVDIVPILFDNQAIDWCYSIKFLGVHLLSGKGRSFDIAPIKRAFCAACNNIFFSFSRCSWIHPVVSSRNVMLISSVICFTSSLPEI